MNIDELSIENLRNISKGSWKFHNSGLISIIGKNGTGKTTLLEAIYLVINQSSFRPGNNSTLIKKGEEKASIQSFIKYQGRDLTINIDVGQKLLTTFNGNQVQPRTITQKYNTNLRATLFTPDDVNLIPGPPEKRRSYLDHLASEMSLKYKDELERYEKAVVQRNRLLKQNQIKQDKDFESSLSIWDERVALSGERIVFERIDLLEKLSPQITQAYKELTKKEDSIKIKYQKTWHNSLITSLETAKQEDLKKATTSVGPHRDDIEIFLNQRDSRTQASRGEQRSLALTFILAGHLLMTEEFGEAPVMLLDDITSELDTSRIFGLLENLPKDQVFITSALKLPGLEVSQEIIMETPFT
ncbi:MAG: DNA replication/repair protein RecF [Acidimicrobiales bacterium]|nr:DNA replication/repair protein RecF [Acidimicrobiales bacterium]